MTSSQKPSFARHLAKTPETAPASSPAQPQEALPSQLEILYPLTSGSSPSAWIVDCPPDLAQQLTLAEGRYSLLPLPSDDSKALEAADRLCSLPAHPGVLSLEAITAWGSWHQLWLAPAEAGSLESYCQAKGKLPLGQVATIAQGLTQALTYLHSQELSYRSLGAAHLVFDIQGRLQLLPPDQSTSKLSDHLRRRQEGKDIAACAAILWYCLTGQKPRPRAVRAPLSLYLPGVSESLAVTLEEALDSSAQQPSLKELEALFALAQEPAPLELHLSAHPSVRDRLPACPAPHASVPVPGRLGRRSQVVGDLSHLQEPAKKSWKKTQPFKGLSLKLGSRGQEAEKVAFPAQGKLPLLPLSAGLALLALGTGAFWLLGPSQEEPGQALAESKDPALSISQLLEEPSSSPEEKAPSSQKTQAEEEKEGPQEISEQEAKALLEAQLADLIDQRSQALASGQAKKLISYTTTGWPLEEADRALLASSAAQSLAQTSTRLVSLDALQIKEQGQAFADVTVEAEGYQPEGGPAQLAAQGIYRQGHKLLQKSRLELRLEGENYLIYSAQPLALTPSSSDETGSRK